ncbi:hypothetical protein T07_13815 [Trichinella nelsoni]|uniref:Uncharacterized protein n=1 Tax=Trichinella nelsoni TaxID=6336 RepID=A0A0V0SKJ1_9BILA|nr:hypothetical protein T07_13815 [Trichinella nelsoni]
MSNNNNNNNQSEGKKKNSDIVLRADAYEKINDEQRSKVMNEMLKNMLLASLKNATDDIEHSRQFLKMYSDCCNIPANEIILQLESSHFPFSAGIGKGSSEMNNLPLLLSSVCLRLEKLVQEKGVGLVDLKFETLPPCEKEDYHSLCFRSKLLSRQLCSICISLNMSQPISDSKMKLIDENFVKAKLNSYAEQMADQNTQVFLETERVNLLREGIALWNGIPYSRKPNLKIDDQTEELNFAKITVMRLKHLIEVLYNLLNKCEQKYHRILLANDCKPPEKFITRSLSAADAKRFFDNLWADMFRYEKVIEQQNEQIKEKKIRFHACETKVRALQIAKETFEREIKMRTELLNSLRSQCESDDKTVQHCSFMQAIQECLNNECNRSTANEQKDLNELLDEAEWAVQADIEMIAEEIQKFKENCQKEKTEHEDESAELQKKYSELLKELKNVNSDIMAKNQAYTSTSRKMHLVSQFITVQQWQKQQIIDSLYWTKLTEKIKLKNHILSGQLQASWKNNLELMELKSNLENENLQYTARLEKLECELRALIPQIAGKEFYGKCLELNNKEKDNEEIYLKQNEIITEEIKYLNEMSHHLQGKKDRLERYIKKTDQDGKELIKKIAELESLENKMKICIGELESHLFDPNYCKK